jgi:hypothetical protein
MSSPVSWEDYATGPSECAPEWSWAWDGLVGLWAPALGPTGNALFDLSGRNNHGTLTNMDPATDWVASPYGWVLDFDGGNDYVNVKSSSSFNTLSDFSVLISVYDRNRYAKYHRYLEIGGYHSASGGGLTLLVNDTTGHPRVEIWNGVWWGLNGAHVMPSSQWVTLAATMNGYDVRLYLNNVLIGNGTSDRLPGPTTESLVIGGATYEKEPNLNGQVASCALYARALSANEIAAWSPDPLGLLRPAWQSPAWWYSPGTPPASSIAAIHDYYRRLRCA